MTKKYSTNPLGLSKKVTADHHYHKTRKKTCRECVNLIVKSQHEMLACPNCDLFCLERTTVGDISSKMGVDFYCSACAMHWGRTDNW